MTLSRESQAPKVRKFKHVAYTGQPLVTLTHVRGSLSLPNGMIAVRQVLIPASTEGGDLPNREEFPDEREQHQLYQKMALMINATDRPRHKEMYSTAMIIAMISPSPFDSLYLFSTGSGP